MASRESGAREHHMRPGHALSLAQRSASYNQRPRSEDSWIEISSQPSSSSLSSVNDEIITTGLRVQQEPNNRRRRRLRQSAPSHLNITSRAPSLSATSSQDEYEESESESDRVMTSSNEGLRILTTRGRDVRSPAVQSTASDDDGEHEDDRTAINCPTNNTNNTNNQCFTPQPNAFSHPSSQQAGTRSVPGSYFPSTASNRPTTSRQSSARHSYPPRQTQHSPYNIIAPNHNAAADHDAALRASLSTLISFAGAARSLSKKSQTPTSAPRQPQTRMSPSALHMVPESALREQSASPARPDLFSEATFKPTLRRTSTSTTASVDQANAKAEAKRKATAPSSARSGSKDRRVTKKRKNSSAYTVSDRGDVFVTPTLLTWVVVAGVGVFISALSFSAGFAMGRESGRLETSLAEAGDMAGYASEGAKADLRKLKSVARTVGVGA